MIKMIFGKRILLLFVMFDAIYNDCTKAEFDNMINKDAIATQNFYSRKISDNLCKSVCGENIGVICKGDLTNADEIECACETKTQIFVQDGRQCKEPATTLMSSFVPEITTTSEQTTNEQATTTKNSTITGSCDKSNKPCENGGKCESKGSYTFCNCKNGTSGDFCETIDDCKKLSCKEVITVCSYDQLLEGAFCKCIENNTAYDLDKKDCVRIGCVLKLIHNECNRENEICDENDGTCKCKEKYKYTDDGESCKADKCAFCPANSDCVPESDDPCKCNNGYFDGKKCVKYGKCDVGFTKCSQGCDALTGKCFCEEGFKLSNDNVTCDIIHENIFCKFECDPGSCVLRDGNETCVCPSSTHKFSKNYCIDVCTFSDGVPPESMKCPGECENDDVHGIRCICNDPYEVAEDGIHCRRKEMCKEINIINTQNRTNALCKEEDNKKGYTLYCDKQFKFDEEGVCKSKCDFRNSECERMNAECDLGENYEAVCRCPLLLTRKDEKSPCNEIAKVSYTGEISVLKWKYVINYEDKTRDARSTGIYNKMELQKDFKISLEYVYNKENLKTVNIVKCNFGQETEDLLACSIEMQLDSKPEDVNAFILPSYCYNLDKGFCLLKNLLIKRAKRDIFKQTNPCILNHTFCDDKSTKCVPNFVKGTFKCTCKEGFYKTLSFPVLNGGNLVEICEDIDECLLKQNHYCPENSTCINTYGNYACECTAGFRKKSGNLDPKKHGCEAVCDPNPCANGGECIQKINHEFICRCKSMYTGLNCNETVAGREDVNCLPIVGSLVGTALVLFLIIAVIVIVVVKKLRIENNYDAEFSMPRQTCVLGDEPRIQKTENEYVEIDLHSNSRQCKPKEVELRHYTRISRDSIIPRAHVSSDNNADKYLEDRCSTYDIPRKYLKTANIKGTTMEYPNKAYGLEE